MRKSRGLSVRLVSVGVVVGAIVLGVSACSSGSSDAASSSADVEAPSSSADVEAPSSSAAASSEAPAGGPVTVDVGDGKSVEVTPPLNLAFFSVGTSNAYLNAVIAGAQEAADAAGITLDVFDAAFDPQKQADQVQTAIQSGKYNGFVFQPVSGPASCDAISVEAPDAGILVSVNIAQACNRGPNEGEDLWQPGTLNYVGGTTSLTDYTAWVERIVADNSGKQKAAFVLGPDLNVPVENAKLAIQNVAAQNPDFEVVAVLATDYTSEDGLKKTQDILQANPDITVVATNYGELTKGAVTAISEAGLEGKIKLYDVGADPFVLGAIANGQVTMTVPYYPRSAGRASVESLIAAAAGGTPIPRVILNDGAPVNPLQGDDPILFLTADNVAQFTSEY